MPQTIKKMPTIHISKPGSISISTPAIIAMIAKTLVLRPDMRRFPISSDSDSTDPTLTASPSQRRIRHPYSDYHLVNKVVIKLLKKIYNIYDILTVMAVSLTLTWSPFHQKEERFHANSGLRLQLVK
jgi:hypothetical protein